MSWTSIITDSVGSSPTPHPSLPQTSFNPSSARDLTGIVLHLSLFLQVYRTKVDIFLKMFLKEIYSPRLHSCDQKYRIMIIIILTVVFSVT